MQRLKRAQHSTMVAPPVAKWVLCRVMTCRSLIYFSVRLCVLSVDKLLLFDSWVIGSAGFIRATNEEKGDSLCESNRVSVCFGRGRGSAVERFERMVYSVK